MKKTKKIKFVRIDDKKIRAKLLRRFTPAELDRVRGGINGAICTWPHYCSG